MAPAQSGPDQDSEMSADEFAERCVAPPEAGPCRAALPRWFYSPKEGCRRFTYGGCRGNRNNHQSQESCQATCSGVRVLPSSKKDSGDEPAAGTAHCRLGPEPGPCRAAFTRFYWDWDSASCRSFLFGGCRGNANNFPSEELCMKGCGGGVAGGRGSSRNRWTAAFFLFLTLAVVSALFLAALVIVMLRRRHLSRHGSSFSDQEELLPEPDELSSLDSLPIPEKVKPGPEA
ncbi:thrombin inhibitor hemalin-like isoform 2-T2 [Menidia menidia]